MYISGFAEAQFVDNKNGNANTKHNVVGKSSELITADAANVETSTKRTCLTRVMCHRRQTLRARAPEMKTTRVMNAGGSRLDERNMARNINCRP